MKKAIKPLAVVAIASMTLANIASAYAETQPLTGMPKNNTLEGLPSDLSVMTDEEMGQVQGELIPLYAFGVCMSSLPCSMAAGGVMLGSAAVIGQFASDAIHGHHTTWQDIAGAFSRGAMIGAGARAYRAGGGR